MKYIRKFFEWLTSLDFFGWMVVMYFLSSLYDLGGIAFGVKHTPEETKVTIEVPKSEEPKIADSPKGSW